jgi:hypothetical protein
VSCYSVLCMICRAAPAAVELLDIYYLRLENQPLDRTEDTYRVMATIQVGAGDGAHNGGRGGGPSSGKLGGGALYRCPGRG